MDRSKIIKKLSYTTQLNPTQTNENLLGMLGFSQKPNHNIEYILEKINYPTSLALPSFEEEVKKMLSSKQEQQATD
jgi:hypothetical protein